MEFTATRRVSTADRLRPAISYTKPVTFQYEIQNHTTRIQKLTKAFKVYRLTVLTFICVVAGILIGLICRNYAKNWTERQFMYIEMPGELYLRLLKLIIIPLLVSNVILSFGTIDGKLSSHLAKVASFLYLGSNLMAITIAVIVALLIAPGRYYFNHQQQFINKNPNYLHQIPSQPNNNHYDPARQNNNNGADNHQSNGGYDNGQWPQIDNHHYFNQYHESINRYRDYHPMFYHTQRPEQDQIVEQSEATLVSSSGIHSVTSKANITNPNLLNETLISSKSKQQQSGPDHHNSSRIVKNPNFLSNLRDDLLYGSGSEEGGGGGNNGSNQHRIAFNTKLPIDVVLDLLRNLVPDNIIGSTMKQARTRLFPPKELVINKDGSTFPPPSEWLMGHEMIDQTNMIGLLAISVLAGVVLSHMDEGSKPMLELCSCISELSLRIGMMTINLTPFCIMFLLIGQVARARDLSFMAGDLCIYTVTVLLALAIHGLLILPLAYYLISKRSPVKFLWDMLEALVASFATSSSSATLALVLKCLNDTKLNPVIVRAFGPLGSVFNMNGTAIYEVVGVIFIAQTLNTSLPIASIMLIALSSAVASLSTTGIPSSGMMTMVIVLDAINLPVLQLSLIYIVDFIIDRFRTVINVWSGAIVCGLIDHICPEQLFEMDEPEKYHEMKRRSTLLTNKKISTNLSPEMPKQVISVTITPPIDSSISGNNNNNNNNNLTTTTNI